MESEQENGLTQPKSLLVNFYEFPEVGHSLIFSLWAGELGERVPDYIAPAQNWEPEPLASCPEFSKDASGFRHYWRTMSIWYAILVEGGFAAPKAASVFVDFPRAVKQQLAADPELGPALATKTKSDGALTIENKQRYAVLPALFRKVHAILRQNGAAFPASTTTGEPYFNATERGLLDILASGTGSGAKKFLRFNRYHSLVGTNTFAEITSLAQSGKTVFVDLSMGDERVRKAVAERISSQLLASQMHLFSQSGLGDRFIVLFFEEAHTLFPKSDREVSSDVYNKIAKEGAKFHISMVYATQSMSTLSPDLLKNTENLIVTHLDDDREVAELRHKWAFRDIAQDVERITSKGHVRMKTVSQPFALPVRIRRFSGSPDEMT